MKTTYHMCTEIVISACLIKFFEYSMSVECILDTLEQYFNITKNTLNKNEAELRKTGSVGTGRKFTYFMHFQENSGLNLTHHKFILIFIIGTWKLSQDKSSKQYFHILHLSSMRFISSLGNTFMLSFLCLNLGTFWGIKIRLTEHSGTFLCSGTKVVHRYI